jgi:hypothetical protein
MAGCCLCSCALWLTAILAVWVGLAYLVNKLRGRKRDALMVVLGSGGHTGEMLYMMLKYDFKRFKKVYCIVGDNDTLSMGKMKNFIAKNNVGASHPDENRREHHRIHHRSETQEKW